jgi:hypothetical protein
MQADLLLVFRVSSDTYTQYRAFAKDKVKAYSTCEMVLLDIRTGLVPFTRVISGIASNSNNPLISIFPKLCGARSKPPPLNRLRPRPRISLLF